MKPNMNAIGIVTADMKRSLQFYGSLGLDTAGLDSAEDHVGLELGNGVTLMWDTVELIQKITPEYAHGKGSGIGLCFECESPASVDSTYAKVVGAGFRGSKEPWDAFWGQRYAILEDPDGNDISLYAPL